MPRPGPLRLPARMLAVSKVARPVTPQPAGAEPAATERSEERPARHPARGTTRGAAIYEPPAPAEHHTGLEAPAVWARYVPALP